MRAAWGIYCLAPSASCAVPAAWVKPKRLPMCYGCAETVDTNSRAINVWVSLMKLGAKTGCHQRSDRSLFFRGCQFPVCARCTGLFAGQAAGIALFWWCARVDPLRAFLCAAGSAALLGLDGFLQLKGLLVSTNPRRLATGLLCGFFVTGFFIRSVALLLQIFGV